MPPDASVLLCAVTATICIIVSVIRAELFVPVLIKKETHLIAYPRIRFDLEKLKEPDIAQVFQAQVGGKFAALNLLDSDVDSLANNIKDVLLTTADSVLGKHRKKIQPMVTDDILELYDKGRELKGKRTGRGARMQYQQMNKAIRNGMKSAKEGWIEKRCNAIEREMKTGNSKHAYNSLKALTKPTQPRAAIIEDRYGNLLTDNNDVLKRWTEYCNDLYNYELNPDIAILQNHQQQPRTEDQGQTGTDVNSSAGGENSLNVLKAEVEAAVHSLKPGKSPGVDNIPAELLKSGGKELTKALTALCQKIWEEKEWPNEWMKSLVIPLPKKGNLRRCQNYRTISLISHPSKIMLRVILNRLNSKAEDLLSEEQAGFRAGRSNTEQIFNCRVLTEKHLKHQHDLCHNFIDFKKAFDRVWHDGLFACPQRFQHRGRTCSSQVIHSLRQIWHRNQHSTEKSKIPVNSRDNINAHITINNEALEEVSSFKYLGVTLTKDGTSAKEIQIRIASPTAAMTRLNVIWKSNINFSTKLRLYQSLVISILLYDCERWTLLAESERRIQAFETKCLRKLLRILYTDRKTNDYVRHTVGDLMGLYEPLLSTVNCRKLAWFGHVTRHDSLSKVILQATVEGCRRRGRQRRNWPDNVKDWTGLDMPDLLATASNRSAWRTMSAATVMSPRRLHSHGVMGLSE
ncbi:hypothetical protein BSL78_18122 [Apostichopus japonicus]|uniref:Reverse transcriptase domain-containing protein n=1 Tax=Stichopus japonicus TaxID=307972 RepID=A0A2G8KAM1_STIJA|nr:hypothetical protein BSL78_18122 [Apostichopus japonicus]